MADMMGDDFGSEPPADGQMSPGDRENAKPDTDWRSGPDVLLHCSHCGKVYQGTGAVMHGVRFGHDKLTIQLPDTSFVPLLSRLAKCPVCGLTGPYLTVHKHWNAKRMMSAAYKGTDILIDVVGPALSAPTASDEDLIHPQPAAGDVAPAVFSEVEQSGETPSPTDGPQLAANVTPLNGARPAPDLYAPPSPGEPLDISNSAQAFRDPGTVEMTIQVPLTLLMIWELMFKPKGWNVNDFLVNAVLTHYEDCNNIRVALVHVPESEVAAVG